MGAASIISQIMRISRRLCVELSTYYEAAIENSKGDLKDEADRIFEEIFLQYEDKVAVLKYLSENPDVDPYYASNICNYFIDIRHEEINAIAEKETYEGGDELWEIAQKEMILAEVLNSDPRYAECVDALNKLNTSGKIIHHQKKQLKKLQDELKSLYEEHEKELFGTVLPEDDAKLPPLKHPYQVLEEAISEWNDTEKQIE